jgi:lipoprotein-anchoring transpeptidase ErfK/SrfK
MFLRTAAAIALVMGLAGSSGEALAQFYPGPPGVAPPPMPLMRPLPPAAIDNDDDLPPYDPPPGYRRAPPAPYGQPQRSYESEALPPPGPYGAAPGREPIYSPPPGQGQYGAAPGYPAGREPAYGPPPGYEQDPRGPAGRPQYGAVPPQQQYEDSVRPPLSIGPGQQGAVDPDITSRLPTDDRPESGPRKELPPQFRRTTVDYRTREPAGTIIVDTANTYLYLVLGGGKAIRYGIGVGRDGFTWSGAKMVSRKAEWPDWIPPAEMISRQQYLPRFMAGGPGNPLGARAMYLGNSQYRIHGTNDPSTIGKKVSSGCFRMTNEDVTDLYGRVALGTKVVVLPERARNVPTGSAALSAERRPQQPVAVSAPTPQITSRNPFAFGLY